MDDETVRPVSVAELTLGADARSAGVARRFLSTTLSTWATTTYGDDALLLLSELVTNAALHARTQIVVRLELKPECLRLAVTDSSPRQPVLRHYSDQATTGRGLALVTALAVRWGIDPHADGSKTVWAEVEGGSDLRYAEDPQRDVTGVAGRDERRPDRGASHGHDHGHDHGPIDASTLLLTAQAA